MQSTYSNKTHSSEYSASRISGLEKLHNLTTMTRMNLRVDLRDGGQRAFAQYSTFVVAKRHYRLTVGGYSGTAGETEVEKAPFASQYEV